MLLASKFSHQKSEQTETVQRAALPSYEARHGTSNHHFDMKMQRARTNNIARQNAITEKTVTSFRSIKVILIDSRDFFKTLGGERERSGTRR